MVNIEDLKKKHKQALENLLDKQKAELAVALKYEDFDFGNKLHVYFYRAMHIEYADEESLLEVRRRLIKTFTDYKDKVSVTHYYGEMFDVSYVSDELVLNYIVHKGKLNKKLLPKDTCRIEKVEHKSTVYSIICDIEESQDANA